MKQKLDLEEVLKFDPYRTYLGYGYLDDVITCSNTHFVTEEPPGITADLSFPRSFLAESPQGFHLSAMNVQVLIPFLCQQLVKAQLAYQKQTLEDFLIISSEQHYKHFIVEQAGLRCCIEQVQVERHQYTFNYGFYAGGIDSAGSIGDVDTVKKAQPAFSGSMTFASKAEDISSAIYIPSTLKIQAEEAYKLKEVYCDEEHLSIEGLLTLKSPRLTPVQVHGAIGLLMKGLFCKLIQIDRTKTMEARAYTIIQQYDLRPPQEKKMPISIQLDREMHWSVKKGGNGHQNNNGQNGLKQGAQERGEEWGFFTARYEVGDVVQGMLKIANPMKGVTEKERELLRKYFTLPATG